MARIASRALVLVLLLTGGCCAVSVCPCPAPSRCCAPPVPSPLAVRGAPTPASAPAPTDPPPEPPAASDPAFEGPQDNSLLGIQEPEEEPAEPLPPLTPEEEAAMVTRSATLRAALPPPAEAWRWERDLVFDGFRLGTVTIEAEPATLADKPVWYVLERTVRQAGEGRVVSESSCFFAPDLALIRGETVLRAPEGTETFNFGRRDGRMEVTAQGSGEEQTVEADVPANATIGMFPVIRFLEAAFDQGTHAPLPLRLAVFDPRQAFGDGAGKPLPSGRTDVLLAHAPPPRAGFAPQVGPIRVSARTPSGRASTVLLDHRRKTVDAIRGTFPHWHLVPAGSSAKRPDWFDRVGETPQSAYQALCTFGRGYHMMKRDLLEMVFHWPTMREHEIAVGNISADVTLEKVKEDFIAEFFAQSKNRTAADCDDLLTQILVTSEIKKGPEGVSITALPVYGGHTFHCAVKDGRWWIMRVD